MRFSTVPWNGVSVVTEKGGVLAAQCTGGSKVEWKGVPGGGVEWSGLECGAVRERDSV
jgi:hypothetical protein